MNTTTPNAQTLAPLTFSRNQGCRMLHGNGLQIAHTTGLHDDLADKANARLLAAAYTAFDRAGRTLNVDAAILAESIDVATLVCAARDAIALMRQLSDEQLAPVQDALDGLTVALDPI